MQGGYQIKYLSRKEIQEDLWNACIDAAGNGLIYGYTYYLDKMADNWDALVLENYRAIMPLPWRRKWTIHYLYQPFLTAQLGVFGQEITQELFTSFLQAVPKKFQYWDFSLNHRNLFTVNGFPLYERSNFVLSLQPSYEELYKNYRDNSKRNIKKSIEYGCLRTIDIPIDAVIDLSKTQAKDTSDIDFEHFKKLFGYLQQNGQAKAYGMLSKDRQLIASAAFIFSHNRWYYILVGNHPNGRTIGASHALIDVFIKDHAGQNTWLDFEGSDIRNLAFFYSSFGAKEEKYAALKLNRLPWWAKWSK